MADTTVCPAAGSPHDVVVVAGDDGEGVLVAGPGAERLGPVGVPLALGERLILDVKTVRDRQLGLDPAPAHDGRRGKPGIGNRLPDPTRALFEQMDAVEGNVGAVAGEGG